MGSTRMRGDVVVVLGVSLILAVCFCRALFSSVTTTTTKLLICIAYHHSVLVCLSDCHVCLCFGIAKRSSHRTPCTTTL
ncbi:hypothetical protein EDB84DRAFT_1530146 [Lactarius hengduanensis]|nr:hypothetical protein EDB84DRAFT_1530146 [Lactarius hengduanensis]